MVNSDSSMLFERAVNETTSHIFMEFKATLKKTHPWKEIVYCHENANLAFYASSKIFKLDAWNSQMQIFSWKTCPLRLLSVLGCFGTRYFATIFTFLNQIAWNFVTFSIRWRRTLSSNCITIGHVIQKLHRIIDFPPNKIY